MELPHLGKHCSEPTCKRLDFLPVRCDACMNIFCSDHMSYLQHACPSAYKQDVQVPICPLCNAPVPSPRHQTPDVAVNEHIERECQSDPAKAKRKVNANKCSFSGCKVKEMIPIVCADCRRNYCLKHRFPDEHKCLGKKAVALDAAMRRQQQSSPNVIASVQGSMSEDEALARALAESMRDNRPAPVRQGQNRRTATTAANSSQRCHVS